MSSWLAITLQTTAGIPGSITPPLRDIRAGETLHQSGGGKYGYGGGRDPLTVLTPVSRQVIDRRVDTISDDLRT